jgi:coenzyme F420-reducing hydrogenase delta subunit
MSEAGADVIVYVCRNCIPAGARVPRQWQQDGARVLVRELPCSGKTDGQYLLHAIEGGARGLCVIACPKGECRLAQGNYRAEVRVRTLQRLLEEVGLERGRVDLVHSSRDDPPDQFEALLHGAVQRACALGASPIPAGWQAGDDD